MSIKTSDSVLEHGKQQYSFEQASNQFSLDQYSTLYKLSIVEVYTEYLYVYCEETKFRAVNSATIAIWQFLTCLQHNSRTSWRSATIESRQDYPQNVEANSVYSMALSAMMKGRVMKKGHNDHQDSDARLTDMAWEGASVELVLMQENHRWR